MKYQDLTLALAMAASLPIPILLSQAAARFGFKTTPARGRLGHVDGLRGLLAVAVLFHHFAIWLNIVTWGNEWQPPTPAFFNNLGQGAVSLFFMITGCVFYPTIKSGFDNISWGKFVVTRLARILPLSIAVTVIAATIAYNLAPNPGREPVLVTAKTLLNWVIGRAEPPIFGYDKSYRLNAGVLWSLWYEWLFYVIILPLLAISSAIIRNHLPIVALPIAVVAGAVLLRLVGIDYREATFVLLFALGMCISEFHDRPYVKQVVQRWQVGFAAVALTGLCMIIFHSPYNTVTLAAYAACLLAIAGGNSLAGFLSSAATRALGDASFSIYMLHGFVLATLMPTISAHVPGGPVVMLPVAAAMTTAIALTSYTVIEKPMIAVGKRVAHWRPQSDRSLVVEVAP